MKPLKLFLGASLCSWLLGCATVGPSVPSPGAKTDPWLDEILKQETLESKGKWSKLKPDIVLKEIPPDTPLVQARSIMEHHGFSCWAGLSDSRGEYLQCTAYKRKNQASAEKIIVKLRYDAKRVTEAEVTVDHDVLVPGQRTWTWSPPDSKRKGN